MVGAVAPSTDIFVVAHEWAAFKAPARVGHGSSQWTASTPRWWAAAGLTLPRQRLIGKSALRAGMRVTVLGVLASTSFLKKLRNRAVVEAIVPECRSAHLCL